MTIESIDRFDETVQWPVVSCHVCCHVYRLYLFLSTLRDVEQSFERCGMGVRDGKPRKCV